MDVFGGLAFCRKCWSPLLELGLGIFGGEGGDGGVGGWKGGIGV